jgi:putative FmdB family regulatory protein
MDLSMPIYEYRCRDCAREFEAIVTPSRPPVCPSCHGHELDKQFSVFAVATKSSSSASAAIGACGTCGDPRGPGSCSVN